MKQKKNEIKNAFFVHKLQGKAHSFESQQINKSPRHSDVLIVFCIECNDNE